MPGDGLREKSAAASNNGPTITLLFFLVHTSVSFGMGEDAGNPAVAAVAEHARRVRACVHAESRASPPARAESVNDRSRLGEGKATPCGSAQEASRSATQGVACVRATAA